MAFPYFKTISANQNTFSSFTKNLSLKQEKEFIILFMRLPRFARNDKQGRKRSLTKQKRDLSPFLTFFIRNDNRKSGLSAFSRKRGLSPFLFDFLFDDDFIGEDPAFLAAPRMPVRTETNILGLNTDIARIFPA